MFTFIPLPEWFDLHDPDGKWNPKYREMAEVIHRTNEVLADANIKEGAGLTSK